MSIQQLFYCYFKAFRHFWRIIKTTFWDFATFAGDRIYIRMETVYHNIQLVSFPLTFVYGLFFLLDPAPRDAFRNHVLARRLFGATLIIWAVYIAITWFLGGELKDPVVKISVNLSRFYIFGSLLEIAFSALVDNRFPIVRKTRNRLILWGVFMAAMALNILFVPAPAQKYVVIVAALYYAYEVYAILRRYYRVYFNMKRDMDNYYSENVSNFTHWMLLSSHGLGIIGFSGIGLAFAPTLGLLIYMVAGIIFFTYMSYSLYRYTLSVGHIKEIVMPDENEAEDKKQTEEQHPPAGEDTNPTFVALGKKVDAWIENQGYAVHALTIQQLAVELGTNRTYLSDYVNSKYSLTFRNWIAQLRIDYSKRLLIGNSALSINTIAEMTGYSYNNFITVFTKMNRISPSQWRKNHVKEEG